MENFYSKARKKISNVLLFKRKNMGHRAGEPFLEKNESTLQSSLANVASRKTDLNAANNEIATQLYRMLKSNAITLEDLCLLISGKLIYNKTGLTPDNVQQLLVSTYCKTNGLFQDILYDFMYKDYQQTADDGKHTITSDFFGTFTFKEVKEICAQIQATGYAVMPKKLDPEYVSGLRSWSQNLDYRIVDAKETRSTGATKVDFNAPDCVTANALEEDLVSNPEVMKLINDPVLKAVVSLYLGGVEPSLIHLCMWWTFKNNKQVASSEAAQLYHYDLDQLKWLKIFIYLSDVGVEQGPHTYLPATHKIGSKNYKIMERGYSRITDEEITILQKEKEESLIAPAGTVIFGDTNCFHKGTPVMEGSRLLLQPTFAASKFLKKLVN